MERNTGTDEGTRDAEVIRESAASVFLHRITAKAISFAREQALPTCRKIATQSQVQFEPFAEQIKTASVVQLRRLRTFTEEYARANPFRAVGIVFLVGLLVRRFFSR